MQPATLPALLIVKTFDGVQHEGDPGLHV